MNKIEKYIFKVLLSDDITTDEIKGWQSLYSDAILKYFRK